ncbi:hypothetical protein ACNFBT_11010 [Pseudomonas sp. NY15181]|uniref:hypothetical protein n=1 Tax=Pseudomonas sp. NY15181 TaxID=3400349 RepID=UPI003A89544C
MSLLSRIRSIFVGTKAGEKQLLPITEVLGIQAKVGDTPTHELASSSHQDLQVMLKCCEAEETNYWKQPAGRRACAAPFYFERVAILSRKAKDYATEVSICERWKAIADDYAGQSIVRDGMAALVHQGPRSVAILGRMDKARDLLARSPGR